MEKQTLAVAAAVVVLFIVMALASQLFSTAEGFVPWELASGGSKRGWGTSDRANPWYVRPWYVNLRTARVRRYPSDHADVPPLADSLGNPTPSATPPSAAPSATLRPTPAPTKSPTLTKPAEGLVLTDVESMYADMWIRKPNIRDYLAAKDTILTPINKHGELRVVLIFERPVDCANGITDEMIDFLLGILKRTYDLWLARLWGYNGFMSEPEDGLPVELYAITYKAPGSYAGVKYAGVKTATVDGFDEAPLGAEASWFHNGDNPKHATHHMVLGVAPSLNGDAGHGHPPYVRLALDNNTTLVAANEWWRTHLFQHEVGHAFYLDDMYKTTMYPAVDGRSLSPSSTVMHAADKPPTDMDVLMMRMSWDATVAAGRS